MKLHWLVVAVSLPNSISHPLKVKNDASTNIFTSEISGVPLTRQQLDDFKTKHKLLSLQEISEENTFVHNGKVYNLHEGEPLEVFHPEATYMHNGKYGNVPLSIMSLIEDEDEIITVKETPKREVEAIMITNKKSGDADFLQSIAPRVLVSVENDSNELKKIEHRGLHLRRQISNAVTDNLRIERNNKCSSYRQIDLAVAYDSSFCDEFSRDKDEADNEIQSIVSMVSSKYQQEGLCVKVKLSHLEGYCDPDVDPYKVYVDSKIPGCKDKDNYGYGVLGGMRKIWIEERKNVHRDVVQLFVGETVDNSEDCVEEDKCIRGCAQSKKTTCLHRWGYAFSQLTYTAVTGKRVTIVAHELGHNNGAGHFNDEGYVMYPRVQEFTLSGFSIDSINAFNSHFSQTSCIQAETAPVFPTSSPTTAGGDRPPCCSFGKFPRFFRLMLGR